MSGSIFPVLLSGGAGTRLWPLSRAMFPKQFIDLVPGDPPMLAETARRLTGAAFEAPIVVCNADHRFIVRDCLTEAGVGASTIMLEPVARNTAPAIAAAAFEIAARDPEGILAVMPSDHRLGDVSLFAEAVARAAEVAASGRLILFGIKPREAHSGYGYINRGAGLPGHSGFHEVERFVEKPDAETAQTYVDSGAYLWNSGIFVLHAKTFLDELRAYEREVFSAAQDAWRSGAREDGFFRLDQAAFAEAPGISIDYAVMERTRRAAVLPLDLDWSDVGSWSALWEASDRDDDGNVMVGDVLAVDSHNNYVRSERALVATIGVEGLAIVDTPDALLIVPKARSQEVSDLVGRLREQGRSEPIQHVRNKRPWGFFETLAVGPRFQVKRLHVRPGGKLSMQRHHHRSEHWVVVQGTATVTVGETEQLLTENESVYISATQWHRLENPGKVPLEIIEVQTGTYLGEDDIERSDDIYNRAPDETR